MDEDAYQAYRSVIASPTLRDRAMLGALSSKVVPAKRAAPAFDAYPSIFQAAGFVVEVYEDAKDWRRLLEEVLPAILAREAELSREIHPAAWARVRAWAKSRRSELADSRRTGFCVRLA